MRKQSRSINWLLAFILLNMFVSVAASASGTIMEQNDATPASEVVGTDAIPAAVPVLTPEQAEKANKTASMIWDLELRKEPSQAHSAAPAAVAVLTPEQAEKANRDAIRSQRNKVFAQAFQSFIHKIGLNNNRISCIVSLLPLLLIFDVLLFKRKKKDSSKLAEYMSQSRRIRVLLSVSLLAFGLLVFVPWSVYFGNSLQFPFIFQDFVNWNLHALTLTIICACIVLLLIPPFISDYLVAVIAGLGLCVYLQAMFMNQHLGTMDGVEPEWSEHRVFGTINFVIWCVIILIPVVLRKAIPSCFSKIISAIAGFVFFLELSATASMVVSADPNVWERTDAYYADGSKQFQLSSEKNVIVFIFDNLSVEFIKLCFEQYPETRDAVKDFIWYDDARSNYRRTFPALHHELTGMLAQIPANSIHEMFERAWRSPSAKSFYTQLKDSGYDTRLYCTSNEILIGPSDCFYDYFSNIQAKDITYIIDYKRLHSCLMQMSGFSASPYFAKKHFFYSFDFSDKIVQMQVRDSSDDDEIPIQNDTFYHKMIASGITTDSGKPVFSFYYTRGTHRPWRVDEKCNGVEKPLDHPVPTTKSCFLILTDFIQLLKQKNIYDKTAILVISDHGAHEDLPGGMNPSGHANPYDMAFMIKPFHENKTALSTDDSKVQSIDVLPTLLQIACGDDADFTDFEGYPPSKIPDNRVRKVYRMAKNKDFSNFDGGEEFTRIWGRGTYNCIQEYNFIDAESFTFNAKALIRSIPLEMPSQKDQ